MGQRWNYSKLPVDNLMTIKNDGTHVTLITHEMETVIRSVKLTVLQKFLTILTGLRYEK